MTIAIFCRADILGGTKPFVITVNQSKQTRGGNLIDVNKSNNLHSQWDVIPPTLLVNKLTTDIFNEATAVPATQGGAITLAKSGQAKRSGRQRTHSMELLIALWWVMTRCISQPILMIEKPISAIKKTDRKGSISQSACVLHSYSMKYITKYFFLKINIRRHQLKEKCSDKL